MASRHDLVVGHARNIAPAMVALRRDLHMYPEVGWMEHRSTRRVAEHLRKMGVKARIRPEGTGIVADLGSGEPIVAFRADLDGLPIEEANDVPYRSQHPGVMHACGHDAHSAIATGVAGVLTRIDAADPLPGTIRMIFQPAEEKMPGGASALCEEGVVDGVTAIAAFHVDPALEPGRIGLRIGGITGASDRLNITLHGPGGHTSRPHQTADLVFVAGRLVTELPRLVIYGMDPRDTLAMVFGMIDGGSAENVIPTEVRLGGTVRMFNLDLWRLMPKVVEQHVHDLVTPLGATADVTYTQGSPPVINHPSVVDAFRRAGELSLDHDAAVTDTHQSLGSEDFAWYLESVPGAMIRLGAARSDRSVDLHSATFDIDESAIHTGITVGAVALLELLDAAA